MDLLLLLEAEMNERVAGLPKPEWKPIDQVFEDVKGKDKKAQEEACETVRDLFGPEAELELRERLKEALFIYPRVQPEAETSQPKQSKVQLPAIVPVTKQWALRTEDKQLEVLEALNAEHAVIDSYGGKAVIASWGPSSFDPSKMEWVFQNTESFRLRYSNRFIAGSMSLGGWWLKHGYRRQYRGVTFAPGVQEVAVNDCLNLWRGWGVEDEPGDWSLLRHHIEEVIAGGNPEFAEYVIRWIAWAIQNPGRQAEVALVLIGEKGSGKGTLVRALEQIFGFHAFQVEDREQVIGKHNAHLQDCILFIADEAYWGGDKRCVGRLQGMITEPKLTIEPKNVDAFKVPNMLHIVMLAEEGWVIPAGRYERRYAALAVSVSRRGDRAYFKELHQHIADGGAAAMFHDLRRMDLGEWHPREIPEALLQGAALQRQQKLSLPPLEQWWLSLLHDGKLPGVWTGYPNRSLTEDLREDAKARFPRLKYDLSDVMLGAFLEDEKGVVQAEQRRKSSANGWGFRPLKECRQAWEKRYGPTKWSYPVEDWIDVSVKPKPAAPKPVAIPTPSASVLRRI
jgi:Family of unknown function (DUF5906)